MTANYPCDLHGHTNRSDGNDTPLEFIHHGIERGVKILAMTDHDIIPPKTVCVDGEEIDIVEYAKGQGLNLLKGIEISCETYIEDVHLVCLGCDWENPYFAELDDFTVKSKTESYKQLVEELTKHDMPMTWEEVLQNGGSPVPEHLVQKKMIFELIARKGYTDSWKDAKLMVKNTKAFKIDRAKPDAVEVIKKIHEIGGIVIMAHPYLVNEPANYKGKMISRKEFIQILIDAGLDGIEASYTYDKTSYGGSMTAEEIKKEVEETYGNTGLIISGGSDYHADGKKGVKDQREIGECGISLEDFMQYDKLKALLP